MERPRNADRVRKSNVLSQAPIVELVGQSRVLIENHRGVLGYSLEEICVKADFGSIRICGCELRIMQLSKEQLVICGHIDMVQMFGR